LRDQTTNEAPGSDSEPARAYPTAPLLPGAKVAIGAAVLVAVLAAAANLRVAVVAVGPVIDDIQSDTGMSSAAASLLVALPTACLGVFAFAGAALVRRFGASRLIAASLLLLAAATLARAAAPTPALLIAATLPIGIAIAMVGVSLPGVIKHHYPARGGATTGLYVASMHVGGALIAIAIVPLSELLGGWRWAFALTAIPAAIGLAIWHRTRTPDAPTDHDAPAVNTLRPPRGGILLGVIFGLQAMVFTGMITWIAAIYIDAGWPPAQAALATASIPLFTILAALVVPRLSDGHDRRYWIFGVALIMGVGTALIGFTPTSAAVLWLLVLGLGLGAIFPLLMALPLDLRETPGAVTDLVAWMLGLGYVMGASSPLLIGALRDSTDGFEIPVGAAMTGAGILCALLVLLIPKPKAIPRST
jgi:CP family cyanate transporter-like MFS transporter